MSSETLWIATYKTSEVKILSDTELNENISICLTEIEKRKISYNTAPRETKRAFVTLNENLKLLKREETNRFQNKQLEVLNRQFLASVAMVLVTIILVTVTAGLWFATNSLVDVTKELNLDKPSIAAEFVPLYGGSEHKITLRTPEYQGNLWVYNTGKFDIYIHESLPLYISCDGKKQAIHMAQLQEVDKATGISNLLSVQTKRRYYSYDFNLSILQFDNSYEINSNSKCKLIAEGTTNNPLLPIKAEIELEIKYFE